MAKKEFTYRGKTLDDIRRMSFDEFLSLLPARARRSLKRGQTHQKQTLLEHIKKNRRKVRTQCRDMIVVPQMIDRDIEVYDGKTWQPVHIMPEMLGHYLGEFALTRRSVKHNAPGIGATRSSASVSVK